MGMAFLALFGIVFDMVFVVVQDLFGLALFALFDLFALFGIVFDVVY
jgi:hypothetical protein